MTRFFAAALVACLAFFAAPARAVEIGPVKASNSLKMFLNDVQEYPVRLEHSVMLKAPSLAPRLYVHSNLQFDPGAPKKPNYFQEKVTAGYALFASGSYTAGFVYQLQWQYQKPTINRVGLELSF